MVITEYKKNLKIKNTDRKAYFSFAPKTASSNGQKESHHSEPYLLEFDRPAGV